MDLIKAYLQPRAVDKIVRDRYGNRSSVSWPGNAMHRVTVADLLMLPHLDGEGPPTFMGVNANSTLDPYPYVGRQVFYFLPWASGTVVLRHSFAQTVEKDARADVEPGDLVFFDKGEAQAYWVSSSVRGFLFSGAPGREGSMQLLLPPDPRSTLHWLPKCYFSPNMYNAPSLKREQLEQLSLLLDVSLVFGKTFSVLRDYRIALDPGFALVSLGALVWGDLAAPGVTTPGVVVFGPKVFSAGPSGARCVLLMLRR